MEKLFQQIGEIPKEDFAKQLSESSPEHYQAVVDDGRTRVMITVADAADAQKYRAAEARAKAAGVELQVIGPVEDLPKENAPPPEHSISVAEAADHQKYRAAQARAEAAGVELQVTP